MPPSLLLSLLSLPAEIHDSVVVHLQESTDDLKATRLSCRALNNAAERLLFREVTWTPDEARRNNFTKLACAPRLSKYVKRVTIQTVPDLDRVTIDVERRDSSREWEELRDAAIDGLRFFFPRAAEVKISFSASNIREAPVYGLIQSEAAREAILGRVLKALSSRRRCQHRHAHTQAHSQTLCCEADDDDSMGAIGRLTIVNLLSWREAGDKRAPLEALTELDLSVRVHRRIFAVDLAKLQESSKSLCDTWLRPTASRLTKLSLYFDSYWGAIPHLKLADLRFPVLNKLLLGNYAFLYPSQIAWLTSLKTLEYLSLDDCPIVAVLYQPGLWVDYPATFVRAGLWRHDYLEADRSDVYINKTRWCDYYEAIGQGLPRLRDFRCGHGRWQREEVGGPTTIDSYRNAFERRHDMPTQIHSTRYVTFIGHSNHTETPDWAEVSGDHPEGNEMADDAINQLQNAYTDPAQMPTLSHEDRLKDKKALGSLVALIRQRHGQHET